MWVLRGRSRAVCAGVDRSSRQQEHDYAAVKFTSTRTYTRVYTHTQTPPPHTHHTRGQENKHRTVTRPLLRPPVTCGGGRCALTFYLINFYID